MKHLIPTTISFICFLSLIKQASPLSFATVLDSSNVVHPETKHVWIKEIETPRKKTVENKDLEASYVSFIDPVFRVTYKFVDFHQAPKMHVSMNRKSIKEKFKNPETRTRKLWKCLMEPLQKNMRHTKMKKLWSQMCRLKFNSSSKSQVETISYVVQ